MRQEDRDEIWHLARLTPEEALRNGFNCSKYIRTVTLDRRVVCLFGVADGESFGVPWMLASPLLLQIKKSFLRECREFLGEMSEGYSELRNIAWSKNTVHIQWLKWLGFEMQPGVPMGPDSEIYIPFYKVI
jgi:hypothetical protein